VSDLIDLTYIENITALDGGLFTPPDLIEWDIPLLDAGDTQQVRFQATVKLDAMDGDMICNTATITSDELKSVAEGGLLENCPTISESIALTPCIPVAIVPGPALGLTKTITSPVTPGPYVVGTTLTFELTVQNVGTADATNVDVWDCLGPCFDSSLVNPLDGGVLNGGANPGCTGDWIRWTIGTLPAATSQVVHFEATLPLTLADLTSCDNTAETNSTEDPTVVPSPQVQFDVCAPVLTFEKTLPKLQFGETERIEWTINLTNNGSCDATGLQVLDTLDFTLLDEATLMFTDPPGSTSSFVSPTITWDLQPLASAATTSWTVSAVTATGQAPTTICNTARKTWDQGVAEVLSDPATGTCAEVLAGGCAPLVAISDLFAVDNSGAVDMSWTSTAAPDGYRVCFVDGFASRDQIPMTCDMAGTGVCDPTAIELCSHAAANPTDVFYYQVKGLCGGSEGP